MLKEFLRICLSAFFVALSVTQAGAEELLRFNRDIRPILSDNCFACHGPDQSNRKADLRLDQTENLDLEEFVKRVLTQDDSEIMPPPASQKRLSDAQKELLKRWAAEGAKYEVHWSFVPPVKPLAGSCIDDFIQAELPKHGLRSSPRAEAATLVRRVALDLTGLPPTIEEQQQFAASNRPMANTWRWHG